MKLLFKVKYLLIVLLLGITSCNQPEEIKINDFITVEITDITEEEEYTGLIIAVATDSIVFASISKDQFDNYEEVTQNLKINQEIKIKGTLYNYNDRKMEDKPKSNSVHSSILDIKEIGYINKN